MVTLWSVLVLLLAVASGNEAQCSASTSIVEFTVTSVKNGTTHRDVTASLLSEMPADSQEPQPVALNVAHWTQRCGGTETVAMDISTASSILAESGKNSSSVSRVTSGATTTPAVVTTTYSPTPTPASPGPDYVLIPGFGFYRMSSDVMTWSEGRRFCEIDGTHMVIFRSKRELDVVRKIWGDTNLWIGMYRNNYASEFFTVTGSHPERSVNVYWASGRPDRVSGDCAYVWTSRNPEFFNYECYYKLRVVCFMSL